MRVLLTLMVEIEVKLLRKASNRGLLILGWAMSIRRERFGC